MKSEFFEALKLVLDPELFVSLDVDPYHLKNVYVDNGYTFIDYAQVEYRTTDHISEDFHQRKYKRLYKENVGYVQVWSDAWEEDKTAVIDHLKKRFLATLDFLPRGYIKKVEDADVSQLLGCHYNPYKKQFAYYSNNEPIFTVFLSMPEKSHWVIEKIIHPVGQNVAIHMEIMMEHLKQKLIPKSISIVLDPAWDDTSWTAEVGMVLETSISTSWLVNMKDEHPKRMDVHKIGMNILSNPINSNCKPVEGVKKEKFTWKRK